jgi:hypothetical protein
VLQSKTVHSNHQIVHASWGIDSKILKKFYTTLIEPILLYGCPIWNGALKQNWCIKQLRQVQRLMLLAICRAYRTVSTNVLLAMAHVLPIDYRATELAASHFFNQGHSTPERSKWGAQKKWISVKFGTCVEGHVI